MEWLSRSSRTAGNLLNPTHLLNSSNNLLNHTPLAGYGRTSRSTLMSAGGALLNPNNLISAGNMLTSAVKPSALLGGANWYSYYVSGVQGFACVARMRSVLLHSVAAEHVMQHACSAVMIPAVVV